MSVARPPNGSAGGFHHDRAFARDHERVPGHVHAEQLRPRARTSGRPDSARETVHVQPGGERHLERRCPHHTGGAERVATLVEARRFQRQFAGGGRRGGERQPRRREARADPRRRAGARRSSELAARTCAARPARDGDFLRAPPEQLRPPDGVDVHALHLAVPPDPFAHPFAAIPGSTSWAITSTSTTAAARPTSTDCQRRPDRARGGLPGRSSALVADAGRASPAKLCRALRRCVGAPGAPRGAGGAADSLWGPKAPLPSFLRARSSVGQSTSLTPRGSPVRVGPRPSSRPDSPSRHSTPTTARNRTLPCHRPPVSP